jgi:hypothetical protein
MRRAAPGLTKIATDNQPASIVRELEEMSRAYIRPKARATSQLHCYSPRLQHRKSS